MSLTDRNYGDVPQADYKHGPTSPAEEGEIYRKRPAMLGSKKGHASHELTVQEGSKRTAVPVRSLDLLRKVTKVKAVSFLLALTLSVLITASYVLIWDRKGRPLMMTPPSSRFHLRCVVNQSAAPLHLSTTEDYLNMKPLLTCVASKLAKLRPRETPALKDVVATDSHLFSVIGQRRFLPSTKSPCWYEEHSGPAELDPYRNNLYKLRSKSFRTACDYLNSNFQKHLYHSNGKRYRLRCLPYFYIIGQPKCGTTDLFRRLLLHPEVRFTAMKEPHWWTRKRFGMIHLRELCERFPVEDYLDLFDLAARHIQEGILGNQTSGGHSKLRLITGEASASTMWDNQAWNYLHDNRVDGEPPFLAQDFIHAAQPQAKIIVMLRDPVERLYSDYLYFNVANKSVEDFHTRVGESLQLFEACLAESSLHTCVYNSSLASAMPVRLHLGLYVVYLLDWLMVFHRDQILVLRLEDYAANLSLSMHNVFDFLSVGPLPELKEAALVRRPMSNTRRAADRSLGPMLPLTRHVLRDFHQPFNHKLAEVLENKAFQWTDT